MPASTTSRIAAVTDITAVLAAVLWAGGLGTLGAIVAPAVFHAGDPHAADVMTVIFSRFDRLAVVCAALIVIAEAVRAFASAVPPRGRALRVTLVVFLAVCAGVQAGWLTPAIVAFHEHGIVRGVPGDGVRFDQLHKASEAIGKITVLTALVLAGWIVGSRRAAIDQPGRLTSQR